MKSEDKNVHVFPTNVSLKLSVGLDSTRASAAAAAARWCMTLTCFVGRRSPLSGINVMRDAVLIRLLAVGTWHSRTQPHLTTWSASWASILNSRRLAAERVHCTRRCGRFDRYAYESSGDGGAHHRCRIRAAVCGCCSGGGELLLRPEDFVMSSFRLRNDLYCVEWGVKLYSLTHFVMSTSMLICVMCMAHILLGSSRHVSTWLDTSNVSSASRRASRARRAVLVPTWRTTNKQAIVLACTSLVFCALTYTNPIYSVKWNK